MYLLARCSSSSEVYTALTTRAEAQLCEQVLWAGDSFEHQVCADRELEWLKFLLWAFPRKGGIGLECQKWAEGVLPRLCAPCASVTSCKHVHQSQGFAPQVWEQHTEQGIAQSPSVQQNWFSCSVSVWDLGDGRTTVLKVCCLLCNHLFSGNALSSLLSAGIFCSICNLKTPG